ncbi:unnamed protein product [Thelazia callipaeda]|uniref:protein disulfide-isomerase n=1 Tax=Thelazia callipaeda TaxID=103827 RepID=A0A0N5D214_THECL|nr:unnamed protein product [Thelazia callipaeda]
MFLRPAVISLLAFQCACTTAKEDADFEKDNGVFVLNENNFELFLQKYPTALVEFYASWCNHCKAFAPEYAKAAKKLTIPLAKVDATVETKLAETYNIEDYPTLKLWLNSDSPIDYDGERKSDEIIQWVYEKTDPTYKSPSSAVVKLTERNFSVFISSHPLVLVKFYASWCGHCKKLAPEYEKAAQQLKGNGIVLAEVDSIVEHNLSSEHDITGYPKLIIFRNKRKFDYNGPRDAAGIVSYMTQEAEPALKKVATVKEAQRFMLKNDVTIIGFFADESEIILDALSDAGKPEITRNDLNIAVCLEKDVAQHFQINEDKIVIFFPEIYWSKYEPNQIVYEKKAGTAEDLVTFFQENSTPLVGHRTRKNVASRYTTFPLVVIYYNVDFSLEYREGTQYWRKKVLDFANKYKENKYRFAISDENEFADELAEVGLGDSGLEHNVLAFGYDGKKYPMSPDEFDNGLEENLFAFMKKLVSGKIKPFIKSAPLPKNDKGPVKTVVASNFAQIVFDETKDVMVQFYAPSCGHCKAFEPKYRELATKLKREEPNLLLVKIDAIANDAPDNYVVNSFPTIYFVPANKKEQPIKYEGDRDLDDLTKFMKKYASVSFQGKTEL